MDDLDFRRRIYADPNDNSPETAAACNDDAMKAKFKAEMQQFDAQLKSVLEVPVPENLAERVLLGQSIANQQKERKKHRVHLALAASFAFAIGISMQFVGVSPRVDTLTDHALAHMTNEMSHIPGTADYTLDQLNVKLANFGGHINQDFAPIKFANFCDFDGIRSLHLVFVGERGDVTVFVVPKNANLAVNEHFSTLKFVGEVLTTNVANVVIITDKTNESVDEWTKKIDKAITWQSI